MIRPEIISASYLPSGVGLDLRWLRMEQIKKEEPPTVQEVAELIDTLFDLDPCEEETTGGEPAKTDQDTEKPRPPVDEKTFYNLIRNWRYFGICDSDREEKVKVYRSHQSEEYRLEPDGGMVTHSIELQEKLTKTLEFEGLYLDMEWPLTGGVEISFATCKRRSGGNVTPSWRVVGNRIIFAEPVVGVCDVTFETICDLVTIKIKDKGGPGECTLYAYYCQAVYLLEIEKPAEEPDMEPSEEDKLCGGDVSTRIERNKKQSCYENVYHSVRGSCSDEELRDDNGKTKSYFTEEDCECPESLKDQEGRFLIGSRTVREYEWDKPDDVHYRNFYEKTCCKTLPRDEGLPRCEVEHGVHGGGYGIDGGVDSAKARWGDDVVLIPVRAENGICGDWRKIQDLGNNNCCDGVPALMWDYYNSPSVMGKSSVATVFVNGGKSPLFWSLSGDGFFTDPGFTKKRAVTQKKQLNIYTNSTACGPCVITVSDGCSSVENGSIKCTDGQWELIWTNIEEFWWGGRYIANQTPSLQSILGPPQYLPVEEYVGRIRKPHGGYYGIWARVHMGKYRVEQAFKTTSYARCGYYSTGSAGSIRTCPAARAKCLQKCGDPAGKLQELFEYNKSHGLMYINPNHDFCGARAYWLPAQPCKEDSTLPQGGYTKYYNVGGVGRYYEKCFSYVNTPKKEYEHRPFSWGNVDGAWGYGNLPSDNIGGTRVWEYKC